MLGRIGDNLAVVVAVAATAALAAHASAHTAGRVWASVAAPSTGPARVIGRHDPPVSRAPSRCRSTGPVIRRSMFRDGVTTDIRRSSASSAIWARGARCEARDDAGQRHGPAARRADVIRACQPSGRPGRGYLVPVGRPRLSVAQREDLAQPSVSTPGPAGQTRTNGRPGMRSCQVAATIHAFRGFSWGPRSNAICASACWPDRAWLRVVRPWPGTTTTFTFACDVRPARPRARTSRRCRRGRIAAPPRLPRPSPASVPGRTALRPNRFGCSRPPAKASSSVISLNGCRGLLDRHRGTGADVRRRRRGPRAARGDHGERIPTVASRW